MAEYIEREAMVKASCERCNGEYAPCVKEHCLLMEVIHSIPAADVRPVAHGKWLESGCGPLQKCSICKATGWDGFYFCPNCGADMREES